MLLLVALAKVSLNALTPSFAKLPLRSSGADLPNGPLSGISLDNLAQVEMGAVRGVILLSQVLKSSVSFCKSHVQLLVPIEG